jgi:putative NADH-flavin reductase
MNIVIFGATGSLGRECLKQSLEQGHQVTALLRNPTRLPAEDAQKIKVIKGDALDGAAVASALTPRPDAVLFAIGVDRQSPENLCADVTHHILEALKDSPASRFIWCGGGSNLVADDQITPGARFVKLFASLFMGKRHRDKEVQLELLARYPNVNWLGIRPLQMKVGPLRGEYRLGFNPFSGTSSISFADCAHAMLGMLQDDTWLGKAPIVQY